MGRKMNVLIQRVYLQSKNMRFLFIIPLIGYYVVIPILCHVMQRNPVMELNPVARFSEVCYSTVPIIAVLWNLFQLRTQIEGESGEVLASYSKMGIQVFVFYLMNCFCFLPVFLLTEDSEGMLMALFLQMLIISFLLNGMVFFLAFALKSISITVLIVFMYHLFATRFEEFFLELRYGMMKGNPLWQQQGMTLFVAGLFFWLLGVRSSKRF